MDLEDVPQKSQRQSSRLPADTPVSNQQRSYYLLSPHPRHEPRTCHSCHQKHRQDEDG